MRIEGSDSKHAQALVYDEKLDVAFLIVGDGDTFGLDSKSGVCTSSDTVVYSPIDSKMEQGEYPALRLQDKRFGKQLLQFLPFGNEERGRWLLDERELQVFDVDLFEITELKSGTVVVCAGPVNTMVPAGHSR